MTRRWLALTSIGFSVVAVIGHKIVMDHDYNAVYHSKSQPSWSASLNVLCFVLVVAAIVLSVLARRKKCIATPNDNEAKRWQDQYGGLTNTLGILATVIAIIAFLWQLFMYM